MYYTIIYYMIHVLFGTTDEAVPTTNEHVTPELVKLCHVGL